MGRMRSLIAAGLLFTLVAAAEPSTQPAEQYPALAKKLRDAQAEVEDLKLEIAKLNAVIETMRVELEKLRPKDGTAVPAKRPANATEASKTLVDHVKPGLSREKVYALLGEPRSKTRKGELIVETFEWSHTNQPDAASRGATYTYQIICAFNDDGVLTDVRDDSNTVRH